MKKNLDHVSAARYRAPMGMLLGLSATLASLVLAAPAHAQTGIHHRVWFGCEVILQTRVVDVAQPPVNVVEQTQQRTKTTCLSGVTYSPWVVVSSVPLRP